MIVALFCYKILEILPNLKLQLTIGKMKEEAWIMNNDKPTCFGIINLLAVYFSEGAASLYICFQVSLLIAQHFCIFFFHFLIRVL